MTREEAIDELNVIYERLSHPEDCEQGVYSFRDGDYLEALDMAIEALEQEPKYCDHNICIKNEYNGIGCDECEVTKSQEPCKDAISRKAVLNTLEFCDKALDVDRTVESYKSLLAECYKTLPSFKPLSAIEDIREEVYQMTLPSTHIFKGNTWASIRHGVNLALEIIDKHIADMIDTESEDKE